MAVSKPDPDRLINASFGSAKRPASTIVNLAGWGRQTTVTAPAYRPETIADVSRILSGTGAVIPRGLGRSYGDASLNTSGVVLTERLNRMLSFEPETGLLRCESGVSLHDVLATFMRRGWFVPVSPGTRHVSVGGAIASDVHGKNHHRDGSIGRWVRSVAVATPREGIVECSPTLRPDLFWATLGGMGLTGIILEVELQLIPIETAWIRQLTLKTHDLGETMDALESREAEFKYSVAWVDSRARQRHLGRGILMFGDHATAQEVTASHKARWLASEFRPLVTVPATAPSWLLNPLSTRGFNAAYYGLARGGDHLVRYHEFFYPLDAVGFWNRLYGRQGLVQYQCVFPAESSREGVRKVLAACEAAGHGTLLTVLKRFGSGRGMLSFPIEGYTLAVDMAMRSDLPALLRRLDDIVVDLGGRVYLAKDAFLGQSAFRAMYPRWEEWMAIRDRIDPMRTLRSRMSARLGLD